MPRIWWRCKKIWFNTFSCVPHSYSSILCALPRIYSIWIQCANVHTNVWIQNVRIDAQEILYWSPLCQSTQPGRFILVVAMVWVAVSILLHNVSLNKLEYWELHRQSNGQLETLREMLTKSVWAYHFNLNCSLSVNYGPPTHFIYFEIVHKKVTIFKISNLLCKIASLISVMITIQSNFKLGTYEGVINVGTKPFCTTTIFKTLFMN
jgi:hypothetical protein